MQEILNKIQEEIRAAWRFRWQALLVAWGVCLVGWLVVLMLPDRFGATARVFVDPSTALRPVIQGLALEQDVNSELNLVRQQLLSDPQLQRVVAQTDLGAGAVTPYQLAGTVNKLRERVEITVQANAQPGMEANAMSSKVYTISYQDGSRLRALKVVDILLNNLMEQTLGGKRQASLTGQRFLEGQIRDYEKRLGDAEQRLAEFKKQNVGLVPGEQQSDYFTRLQTEIDAVKKSQGTLALAATRREALQRQLRGEAPIAASGGMPATAGGAAGAAGGGDTLSRINETQARLEELLVRFTDKHPDVIALRHTLEELKARRARELEALSRGDPNAAAVTGASSNPVYQSIQLALNQADIDIAGARGELTAHQQKVADLQRMVDTMPQVEAQFARLNRDYNVTRTQYTALVERLEKARLGEEAEATGSLRFEVIDPPIASFSPVAPRRTLLLGAVFAIAIGLGGGLAYLLNLMKPVFSSVNSLELATGLRVLGSVGVSRTDAQEAQQRRATIRYSAAAALLMGGLMVALVAGRYFSPLGDTLSKGAQIVRGLKQ